jgi:arylsulfatase A-like enzyme
MRLLILFLFLWPFQIIAQRPNIIYIMTDDMGYGDLSCYGRKEYTTPNLDRLASQGMKFTNAYSAGAVCTPTRVGFMTGRYPARTPIGLIEPLTTTKKDSKYGLTRDVPSVSTLVKQAGYQTALIGKWHLGFLPKHSPRKNGFEYFFGSYSGATDYVSHKNAAREHDLWENDAPVYHEGYLTDLLSTKAVAFIESKHKKPFFLVINFNAPHWPWQGPKDKAYPDSLNFTEGGSLRIYASMMKSLDDAVGSILLALERAQLSSNTIVIFTNDNGGEQFSDNGGLSNLKESLWEGGIRVPAFVRWPGKITPGTVTEQVAITMDWSATILSVAGAKTPRNLSLDGIDLMPILMRKEKSQ